MKNINATGTTWRHHTQLSSLTVRCASLCQGILSFGVASSDAHTPLPLPKHTQSGRSMIEMLGVLAIIGVLSVGGIMGYSKAMFRYKVNKTIEQITYISGNVRTTFANQGNYNGVYDQTIWKKAHIFPDDMWKEGERYPQHAWDGNVFLEVSSKNSADTQWNKAFFTGCNNLPQEACIELITHDWSNAQVRAIQVQLSSGSQYYFVPPAKLDDAVKMCKDQDYAVFFLFDIDTSDSRWKNKIDATTAALAGS